MKAFKNWAGSGFNYGPNPLDRPILAAKRKAWRAALEWLRRTRIADRRQNGECNPDDLIACIDEELEE